MSELSDYLVETLLNEEKINDYVVVYAGRFQPFHKGHFATYKHLVGKFGKDNVFIGTSDKTDKLKSPFNFKEKREVMTKMFGIPSNKIVQIKNPYAPTEILNKFNEDTTAFITVVGEKDQSRLGGKYFEKYNGNLQQGYKDKGYVYVSPSQPNPISGTDVRNWLGSGSTEERQKLFTKAYPKFDKKIFDLITKKLDSLNERIFISKEVIQEYISQNFDTLIKEATNSSAGSGPTNKVVDDGPNFFFPNFDTFDKVSQKRAEEIGYTVFKQIMSGELEDYYEHPIYPKGPVKAVTPFPAGVIGKTTATNQKDFEDIRAYSLWFRHIKRVAGATGWDLVRNQDELETRILSLRGLKALGKQGRKDSKASLEESIIKEDTIKLFQKSLGIDREDMPQIQQKDMGDYLNFLKGRKVAVHPYTIPVSQVGMTQKNVNLDIVHDLIKGDIKSLLKPVIFSKDDYVMDGHHRIVALYNIDPQTKLKGVQVDLPIKELLEITSEFPKVSYKGIEEYANIFKPHIKPPHKQLGLGQPDDEKGINENITIPVKVGDTILTGRFKNKRTVVKTIGKDEYGLPTINGRKVVNFRIVNENIEVYFDGENIDELMIGYPDEKWMKQHAQRLNKLRKRLDKSNDKYYSVKENSSIDGLGGGNNSARWTAPGKEKKLNFAQLSGYTQEDYPTADELDISGEEFGYVSTSSTAKYHNKRKAKRSETGELIFEENLKESIESSLQSKYKVDLDVYEYPTHLELRRIVVPQDKRGQGIGSKVMNDLIKYAQSNNKDLFTTPDSSFGGSKPRLVQFYKSFGFKDNKGSNRDFRSKETMVRLSEGQINENAAISLLIRLLIILGANALYYFSDNIIDSLTRLIKPGNTVILLKRLKKNKQFYKELGELIKKDSTIYYNDFSEKLLSLPSAKKELEKLVKDKNLSDSDVRSIKSDIQLRFRRSFLDAAEAIKRQFPQINQEGKLNEGKQVGVIYHYTDKKGLDAILKSNSLKSGQEYYLGNDIHFISFTRNKNFHKKGMSFNVKIEYRIAIDGNKLSNRYKIKPFAYIPGWDYEDNFDYDWLDDEPESVKRDFFNATGEYDEQEERITFKKPTKIPNIKSYILKVDKVSDLKANEGVLSEIPMDTLQKIDQYADKQLNPVDIVLTDKHFFDRLQDPRNKKDITPAELIGFFKRLAKNKNKFVDFLNQYGQIVAKDNRSKINIPFMKQANKVIAKTIMRKDDFKTTSPEYKFEKKNENMIKLKELLNKEIIKEGGAYGHMNHPFDVDVNLTFGQLKDIVKKALSGNLELTREKTDGQALAISWKNGRLIAARNKGHLKNAGENALDIQGLAQKFGGRGTLSDAYNFAMKDLSVAISQLSDKQKKFIFQDGKSFMNLEVIWPDNINVVPYGQALLVFHGTMEYDEAGTAIGQNQQAGKILAGMIKQINQHVQSKYTIQGPPVTKLPKNQELKKLQPKYLGMINKLQSEFKLKDNQGIGEYHQAWWKQFIEKNHPNIDEQEKIGLIKRWAFYDKGFRINTISDPKIKQWADKIDKQDHSKIAKENTIKFEKIFLGVGSDILQFMSSVLTVNPDKAKRDMVKRLEQTIKDVEAKGNEKQIEKLKLELRRLQDLGGFDKIVPNEGIVFDYNGYTMKLTGAFAPLNQLVGIFYSG